MTVRNLVEGRWNLPQARRRVLPPWGLWGGLPGSPPDSLLSLPGEPFETVDVVLRTVPAQSRATVRTAGGGGWGDPLERDPALVLEDVGDGLVSVDAAERCYGVVIRQGEILSVDADRTAALRAAVRAARSRSTESEVSRDAGPSTS